MQTVSPYKTAAELGIEQWEHDGLVALIGPLSRNELRLNMDANPCGTVLCIGGWVASQAQVNVEKYVKSDASKPLGPLFYPGGCEYGFGLGWFGFCSVDADHLGWNATAFQAARAIVNFLTLGDPRWDDVMRETA